MTESHSMIRIVIADDHAILREGLKQIVAHAEGIVVVAEAADGLEVMQCVRECDFDVLLLDLSMPGRSGLEVIKLVKSERPSLSILVLSMHQELQYAVRAIRSGARGYMTKETAPAQLVQAIRKIAAGRAFVSPEVAEQLALHAQTDPGVLPHEHLSSREFEVMRLLTSGATVTNIAAQIHLSVKTVSTHKANLMQKMGLQNHSDLLRYAIRHGLSEPLEP